MFHNQETKLSELIFIAFILNYPLPLASANGYRMMNHSRALAQIPWPKPFFLLHLSVAKADGKE